MVMRRVVWSLVCGLAMGCNVAASSEGTGGVETTTGPGSCPHGLLVASSDYTSTNVSVLAPDGSAVLSESIISSASVPPGLSTALSGDVVFPSAAPTSTALVLIDRTTAVLTWLNPTTAIVERQVEVGTGFAANPQDYLEVAPGKAYVSRYETNAKAGQQAFDAGGDLLILDPSTGVLNGRIDMASPNDGDVLPRPARLLRVGEQVWVDLARTTALFERSGDGRIVGVNIADDSIAWQLDLVGAVGCGGVALSPSGHTAAIACSSLLAEASAAQPGTVILLDATKQPPVELKRISTASLEAPLSSSVAFVSETILAGVAFGDFKAPRSDVLFTLDTTTGTAQVLATADEPFAFGDLRCSPGCANQCLVADAPGKQLRVFAIDHDALIPAPGARVDDTVGLPPRSLGAF